MGAFCTQSVSLRLNLREADDVLWLENHSSLSGKLLQSCHALP